MRRILLSGLPFALLALAASPPAFAQGGPGGGGGPGLRAGAAEPTPAFGGTRAPPPTALPGISGRQAAEPIPAGPNVANLSPNAALFDAINRGDLPAARDAVGRGADLESRNVLGLTPLEAAIDQGRHSIYFFLVSARGSTRSSLPPGDANMTPQQRAARERQARAEADRLAREDVRRAAQAVGAGRGAAPQPAGPRLFANDGGAPQPDAGFLGFDAGRGGASARAGRGRGG